MERFRWLTLFLGALVAGAVAYVLIGRNEIPQVVVLCFMVILTGWFYLKDWDVDSYSS